MVKEMPRSAKPVEYDERFSPLRGGASALGGAMMRNPLAVGGATAFLVAFSYVSANAVWYQPHFHPGAFFATRDVGAAARLADTGSETTIKIERDQPVRAVPLSDPVVERVQAVLSDLEFYTGKVDGVTGPNTRKAIESYRKTVGLAVSGEIDEELLDHLGAREKTAAVRAAPEGVREVAEAEQPVAEKVSAKEADPRVLKIQAGLKAFGHETMEIDGIMGTKTKAAIKEFQTLFGLPATGEADEAVYAKMREVGLTN